MFYWLGLDLKGLVTFSANEKKVASRSNNSYLDNGDKLPLFTYFFASNNKEQKRKPPFSPTERQKERMRDRKRERHQRDGTQAVRQGGGENRLRENQRQRDRGLKRETKSERGAREKMVYVYSIRCHK